MYFKFDEFVVNIPFSPPFIDASVEAEVLDALRSGWITTGPKVRSLEEATAQLAGVSHALCVNSATSTLMLVLHWYGVGRGDEVIVPACIVRWIKLGKEQGIELGKEQGIELKAREVVLALLLEFREFSDARIAALAKVEVGFVKALRG